MERLATELAAIERLLIAAMAQDMPLATRSNVADARIRISGAMALANYLEVAANERVAVAQDAERLRAGLPEVAA